MLTVQIDRMQSIHVVKHVFRQVLKVGLEVTWACVNDIVDQKSQKLLLVVWAHVLNHFILFSKLIITYALS